MRNISITTKFVIFLTAIALFVVLATCYSSLQMVKIDGRYTSLLNEESSAATSLARANRSMQNARAVIGDLLMSQDGEITKASLGEFDAARGGFLKAMDEALRVLPNEAALPSLKERGQQILQVVCKSALDLAAASETTDEIAASQRVFLSSCQPAFPSYSKDLIDETQRLLDKAVATRDEVGDMTVTTIATTAGAIIAGLLVFLGAGLIGIRAWVVVPINRLAATMSVLADGQLEVTVPEADRHDELGGMARAVEVFKDNAVKARRLESEAEQNRAADEDSRRSRAEAERRRVGEMSSATKRLGEGMRHLADGDLTFMLEEPFAEDFEALRADFNSAVIQLAKTLAVVSGAAQSIDSGATEIAASTDDLSRRTEQQAASLEETAAALDQVTSNVSNASKRSDEARTIAGEASSNARQSAEIVSQAVGAIGMIEASSRQISSIIGVIDEIAFQTNLLALNAGVEAARAGEAGKGFAVVAQEVRDLAQRSATAAKEIKDLISRSEAEVENGAALVRETGAALSLIQSYVENIDRQIDAIAVSAKEQAAGLTQVNTAVNEMDHVTQQNAAMVEQANAATATLAEQSRQLQAAVAAFVLPDAVMAESNAATTATHSTSAARRSRMVAVA